MLMDPACRGCGEDPHDGYCKFNYCRECGVECGSACSLHPRAGTHTARRPQPAATVASVTDAEIRVYRAKAQASGDQAEVAWADVALNRLSRVARFFPNARQHVVDAINKARGLAVVFILALVLSACCDLYDNEPPTPPEACITLPDGGCQAVEPTDPAAEEAIARPLCRDLCTNVFCTDAGVCSCPRDGVMVACLPDS